MAERVGFEPTHALTRLTDFESAPLGLLGTSPQNKFHNKIYCIAGKKKNQALYRGFSKKIKTIGYPTENKDPALPELVEIRTTSKGPCGIFG